MLERQGGSSSLDLMSTGGYIINKDESQATGAHFNLPGHSLANIKSTILEQVHKKNDIYRKETLLY